MSAATDMAQILSTEFGALRGQLTVHPTQRYEHRDGIVAHCSAVDKDMPWSRVAAHRVRDPQHRRPGAGYHIGLKSAAGRVRFLVFHDLSIITCHARQANRVSIGVCLTGAFARAVASAAEHAPKSVCKKDCRRPLPAWQGRPRTILSRSSRRLPRVHLAPPGLSNQERK